jgi:5-keto 4-deoxyuronate isomerase
MVWKKHLKKILFFLLALNIGRMAYNDLMQPSQEELKTSFEQYFTENDDRIKMTYFHVDKNTVGLALELSGIGENLNSKDKTKIKTNSGKYIKDKVCSDVQLVEYINAGNYVSIDIRNGDSYRLENIMNLSFSKGSCV